MQSWSKHAYETSVSSRCWWSTPYDEGWEHCPGLREDDELRQIVETEQQLGPLPDWVEQIDRRLRHPTPVKRWLVRLYVHRLLRLAEYASIKNLVNPPDHPWRGTKPII